MQTTQLIDKFNRKVNYLRISVTDRCDFRCVYCMDEQMTFLPRAQLLTLEEIELIGRAFVELGVTKIRITGGEPLVRNNVMQLFDKLGQLTNLKELVLTTNGSHLHTLAQPLKNAGVKRINISLDSLKAERFTQITRVGQLSTVLQGIDTALKVGFERLKLNTVILKNRNEDEIIDLVNFAIDKGIDISFIEEMPLGIIGEHDRAVAYYSSDQIRQVLTSVFSLIPTTETTGGPAKYYRIPNTETRVGFISPHSHNFCESCNRVRLTTEGRLLLCLGQEHSVDLRRVIRANPYDIEPLKQAIINAMEIKPKGHDFDLTRSPVILRYMNMTGG
ncbi:GTP 3',8-cyclase MoaA [Beggiatoa leptomitoformis]|uniref:GTP 3',8-cyclase n=1 Tax=Beggiatoa leptomitoformis TaxID=288004 RepID=A0A2N9YE23_9GAMM|nr:GTP 3',8-cyclase MoaA [Beggiatoa leptomitoformis]ALG68910.1 GTP 3',8-cyclase MoaA [Beggiatoa leptomitoformis]AUI68714.1 GTP 3',8-cyclase MoaA [Beggiatoa leptomitoformis]